MRADHSSILRVVVRSGCRSDSEHLEPVTQSVRQREEASIVHCWADKPSSRNIFRPPCDSSSNPVLNCGIEERGSRKQYSWIFPGLNALKTPSRRRRGKCTFFIIKAIMSNNRTRWKASKQSNEAAAAVFYLCLPSICNPPFFFFSVVFVVVLNHVWYIWLMKLINC